MDMSFCMLWLGDLKYHPINLGDILNLPISIAGTNFILTAICWDWMGETKGWQERRAEVFWATGSGSELFWTLLSKMAMCRIIPEITSNYRNRISWKVLNNLRIGLNWYITRKYGVLDLINIDCWAITASELQTAWQWDLLVIRNSQILIKFSEEYSCWLIEQSMVCTFLVFLTKTFYIIK